MGQLCYLGVASPFSLPGPGGRVCIFGLGWMDGRTGEQTQTQKMKKARWASSERDECTAFASMVSTCLILLSQGHRTRVVDAATFLCDSCYSQPGRGSAGEGKGQKYMLAVCSALRLRGTLATYQLRWLLQMKLQTLKLYEIGLPGCVVMSLALPIPNNPRTRIPRRR
jgi:hypothetical protein